MTTKKTPVIAVAIAVLSAIALVTGQAAQMLADFCAATSFPGC